MNTIAADDLIEDAVTADEVAHNQIVRERASGAAVENLQHLAEPYVGEEQQQQDDLMARIAPTVHGKSMTSRDVRRGVDNIVAAENEYGIEAFAPAVQWAEGNDERQAYLLRQAANDVMRVPSQQELDVVGVQIAARQRINELEAKFPPGTEGYKQHMAEIQRLWQIESGSTPICGKSLRSV